MLKNRHSTLTTSRSRPDQHLVDQALAIRIEEQQSLMDLSWMVAVSQGQGGFDVRREIALRQSVYAQLRQRYQSFCREHGLCQQCNGHGEWENKPGVIGPCWSCDGTGWDT